MVVVVQKHVRATFRKKISVVICCRDTFYLMKEIDSSCFRHLLKYCSRGFFLVHCSQMLSSNLFSWLIAYLKGRKKKHLSNLQYVDSFMYEQLKNIEEKKILWHLLTALQNQIHVLQNLNLHIMHIYIACVG